MSQDGNHRRAVASTRTITCPARDARRLVLRPADAGLRRASLISASAALLLAAGLLLTTGGTTQSSAQDAADAPAEQSKYLVLFDGRVLEGRITDRPGGYLLEYSGGRIVIPFDFIKLTAVSLDDAYTKQRDNLTAPTAGDHIVLGRWCHTNRLYAQAKEELTAALRLEPERYEARELLKRVVAAAAESTERSWRNSGFDTIEAPPSRTSAGVSSEVNAEYIRRVQPLLVNKCGNATCHGRASTNTFRLKNVKAGNRNQRLESDQNLASILAQLDVESPHNSPLLRQPQDRESLVHRGVFIGRLGEDQLQILRDWVELVASEGLPTPAAFAEGTVGIDVIPSTAEDSTVSPVTGNTPKPPSRSPLIIEIPRTPRPNRSAPSAPTKTVADQDTVIRRILAEEETDAFDPDEFNRQVHGSGAP